MKLEYIVDVNFNNKTIKDILISRFKVSHKLLIKLKKEECVFLNDIKTHIYKTINIGDKITVNLDYVEDNSNIISKEIPLEIIYEDDWYLVINKPAGIPVHPSILHYEDSLSSGIKFYFDKIGLKKKIRPVNRIDKDTSGLVIFAKNEYIQEKLIKQMQSKEFNKEYIAIVEGIFNKKQGTISAPITRKEGSIIERCINEKGASSITHYEVIKEATLNNISYSVLRCLLETGRTHQIRVHMSYIGHPLLGDNLYGGDMTLINRQALHSSKISFVHPIYNKPVSYESPIPNDLKILLSNS